MPYALMHMRRDPSTMQLPENMDYPEGVCRGVASELATAVQRAMTAGIEPWRLILDPGADADCGLYGDIRSRFNDQITCL